MAKATLRDVFTYHAPFGDQQERYLALREAALEFSQLITDMTPPSREQSLALTDVQRACQMANAAIAINERPVFHPAAVDHLDGRPIPLSQQQYDDLVNQTTAEPVAATQEQP